MMDKLDVPRRKIRKNWYVGLDPDPVDYSHPDIHDDLIAKEVSAKNSISRAEEGHYEDQNTGDRVQGATVENVQELEEEAGSSFDLFRDADEYNYDYDDYVDESM